MAYENVRGVLTGLRFSSMIGSSFAPAGEFCEKLLATSAEYSSAELSTEGAARLAHHRGRYTMNGEREAHTAAVATVSVLVPVEATSAGADSIELFAELPGDLPPVEPDASAALATVPGENEPKPAAKATPDLGDGVELF